MKYFKYFILQVTRVYVCKTMSLIYSNLEILRNENSGITCKRNLFEVTCEESSSNKGICILSDENSLPILVINK
jgi:hypothetical protein